MEPSFEDEMPSGDVYHRQWEALAAWFLGPKAENSNLLKELISECVESHSQYRINFFKTDKRYISRRLQESEAYKNEVKQMRQELARINKDLTQTVPYFSSRYQGHMNWDVAMPGNIGYFTGMLYNQNNVAAEGGPVTTLMEIEVGNQLCKMLGYNSKPLPWGHITCGGTVANIEAAWSARNLKFYPLSLKKALLSSDVLKKARDINVQILRKGAESKLISADDWDLLNLGIDDIVSLPERASAAAGITMEALGELVKPFTVESMGLFQFCKEFNINETPKAITPASNHYSWPKAMTLIGLGDSNILHTELDIKGRSSTKSLEMHLNKCLKDKIPVIMVVAIMGTTEEGSIDPIKEIYDLRGEFQRKGLNFSIHADAAWGGYLCTMLEASSNHPRRHTTLDETFIANIPLNRHAKLQLSFLKNADTITVDPHKTGLIPYPAGGLCYRNGLMRNFVSLKAPVVYHGDDPNVGVYGIEGSKPGASAVATLLAHRVIGLDQHGYGQILSQCMVGAKLFYCLWLCLPTENDPFVTTPLVPLPSGISIQECQKFVNSFIAKKSPLEMMTDVTTANFLAEIGGDALVNAFVVNLRGNNDVKVANKLMMAIFNKLVYANTKKKNQRVPMIITQSEKGSSIGAQTLKQLKEACGLYANTNDPMLFLINTVLNPWISSYNDVSKLGVVFKEAALLSVGEILDHPCNHGFISAGVITDDGFIFGDHLPVFTESVHQYHAIAKFKFIQAEDIQVFKAKQLELSRLPSSARVPVIFGNPDVMTLPNLMYSEGRVIRMDCFAGLPSATNPEFMTADAIVVDIVQFKHFDMTVNSYPKELSYWVFGDQNGTYMSHIMTKRPDMHQLVELDSPLANVPRDMVELGFLMKIPRLPGAPKLIQGMMVDPLESNQYTGEYDGPFGEKATTLIKIGKSTAKIWTDFEELNVNHEEEDSDSKLLAVSIREAINRDSGDHRRMSRMAEGMSSRNRMQKERRPLTDLLDRDFQKYLRDLKGAYGTGLTSKDVDKNAPAHPGDVVVLKDYPDKKYTVSIVIPSKKVLAVSGEDKQKAIVRYSDVTLFKAGSFMKKIFNLL